MTVLVVLCAPATVEQAAATIGHGSTMSTDHGARPRGTTTLVGPATAACLRRGAGSTIEAPAAAIRDLAARGALSCARDGGAAALMHDAATAADFGRVASAAVEYPPAAVRNLAAGNAELGAGGCRATFLATLVRTGTTTDFVGWAAAAREDAVAAIQNVAAHRAYRSATLGLASAAIGNPGATTSLGQWAIAAVQPTAAAIVKRTAFGPLITTGQARRRTPPVPSVGALDRRVDTRLGAAAASRHQYGGCPDPGERSNAIHDVHAWNPRQ
jgi:hypothetical protein